VATRARAALEGATAARVAAEAALAAGEAKVADLEETAARAQHNATHPPEQVAMSEWTAFTCHPALVLVQPGLTDMEKAAATLQVKLVAQLCGLEEALIAEGHAEGRKAAEDEARKRPVLVSPDGSPGSTRLVPPIGTWRGGRHWNVRGGASKPPGSTGPSGATWSQGCAIPSRPACALSPYRPSIVGGGRQRHPAARRSFPLLGSQGPSG
jgi:hypothetical protein